MISKIVLGTAQLGLHYGINNKTGKPAIGESLDLLQKARAQGIDMLDTAEAYGDANEIIGRYHTDNPAYKVINKVSGPQSSGTAAVQSQLERLKVRRLYTLHYHSFADFSRYPEMLQDMLLLRSGGLIEKIGISVYTNEELEAVIANPAIDVVQLPFNLLDNRAERGALIDQAKAAGKEVHVRSVFLQGVFFMDTDRLPDNLKPLRPYLGRIQQMAAARGIEVQTLALNYVLQQQGIDRVVIGVDTVGQLEDNIRRIGQPLAQEVLEEVDAIRVAEKRLLSPSNW